MPISRPIAIAVSRIGAPSFATSSIASRAISVIEASFMVTYR